jgi:hypothetical protein
VLQKKKKKTGNNSRHRLRLHAFLRCSAAKEEEEGDDSVATVTFFVAQ